MRSKNTDVNAEEGAAPSRFNKRLPQVEGMTSRCVQDCRKDLHPFGTSSVSEADEYFSSIHLNISLSRFGLWGQKKSPDIPQHFHTTSSRCNQRLSCVSWDRTSPACPRSVLVPTLLLHSSPTHEQDPKILTPQHEAAPHLKTETAPKRFPTDNHDIGLGAADFYQHFVTLGCKLFQWENRVCFEASFWNYASLLKHIWLITNDVKLHPKPELFIWKKNRGEMSSASLCLFVADFSLHCCNFLVHQGCPDPVFGVLSCMS